VSVKLIVLTVDEVAKAFAGIMLCNPRMHATDGYAIQASNPNKRGAWKAKAPIDIVRQMRTS
jgi:hypothetical protein